MAGVHINKENKILPCSAKTPELCPVRGQSGYERDHFTDETQAQIFLESVQERKHPHSTTRFTQEKKAIIHLMKDLGLDFNENEVMSMSSQEEIVDRLFHGSYQQYESFVSFFSKGGYMQSFNPSLRQKLAESMIRGAKINMAIIRKNDISLATMKSSLALSRSSIDVIGETSALQEGASSYGRRTYTSRDWLR